MALIYGVDWGVWQGDDPHKCSRVGCNWSARVWTYTMVETVSEGVKVLNRRYCCDCWFDVAKRERWL